MLCTWQHSSNNIHLPCLNFFLLLSLNSLSLSVLSLTNLLPGSVFIIPSNLNNSISKTSIDSPISLSSLTAPYINTLPIPTAPIASNQSAY